MPSPTPEIAGVNLVFVGAMNPTIFQPSWLAAHELIREEEAESADIAIVHPDVVSYSLDWAVIEVSRERFQLGTTATAEAATPILDLAVGIFTILKHSPIKAMGINSDAHYKIESEDRWHEIGHTLAPDSYWTDVLERPGMRTLLMEGARTDDYKGWVRVTVEPSSRVHPGIYCAVNDHYVLDADGDDVGGAEKALSAVREKWTSSLEIGQQAAEHILQLA